MDDRAGRPSIGTGNGGGRGTDDDSAQDVPVTVLVPPGFVRRRCRVSGSADRLVDTVKAETVPRVWDKIRQVPDDVWVKDCEGDKFIWRDRKLYYGSRPWGDVSIHFDNGLGPFTEVIDD